jgi:hypothetical protein
MQALGSDCNFFLVVEILGAARYDNLKRMTISSMVSCITRPWDEGVDGMMDLLNYVEAYIQA